MTSIVVKSIDPLVDHYPITALQSVNEPTLSVIVVGASGDLAKKKIFSALFALYYEDFLPENFTFFGYSRTKMNDEELRNMISETLTCRVDQREPVLDVHAVESGALRVPREMIFGLDLILLR